MFSVKNTVAAFATMVVMNLTLGSGTIKADDRKPARYSYVKPAGDAGTITLDVHLASYHSDRCYRYCTEEYNESNYGLGLSYAALNWLDIGAGSLTNSFNKQSKYAVFVLNKDFITPTQVVITPAVAIGTTTGYEGIGQRVNDAGYSPVLIPSVSLKYQRFSTNIGYIPAGYAGKSNVVTLRVGIALN